MTVHQPRVPSPRCARADRSGLHEVAGEVARRVDLDLHDRLEDRGCLARVIASLKANVPAILKDSSFESTAWYEPSKTVALKSTIG